MWGAITTRQLQRGRGPVVTGPRIKPKNLVRSSVYLPRQMWPELDEAADFQSLVFKHLGVEETASRNDMVREFLRWALELFWQDKGGRPISDKEREDKAKRFAELLRKEEALDLPARRAGGKK
jgi:hypothetical protein